MQRLKNTNKTSSKNLKETKLSDRVEVPLKSTKGTETQTDIDIKKEAKLTDKWVMLARSLLGATLTDKWVMLIRSLLGSTTYLGIAFVMIVLMERGIFALMVSIEQGQMLSVVEDIADTSTIIMYVIYLFVVVLTQIKHLLAVFSL